MWGLKVETPSDYGRSAQGAETARSVCPYFRVCVLTFECVSLLSSNPCKQMAPMPPPVRSTVRENKRRRLLKLRCRAPCRFCSGDTFVRSLRSSYTGLYPHIRCRAPSHLGSAVERPLFGIRSLLVLESVPSLVLHPHGVGRMLVEENEEAETATASLA